MLDDIPTLSISDLLVLQQQILCQGVKTISGKPMLVESLPMFPFAEDRATAFSHWFYMFDDEVEPLPAAIEAHLIQAK